jgi:hypothetical protein
VTDWRLTPDSEAVLAAWREKASPAHQRRLAEVLGTLADGSWRVRWWNQEYPSNRDLREIRAGDGLIVLLHEPLDGGEPVAWIDLVSVSVVEDDEADLGFPKS